MGPTKIRDYDSKHCAHILKVKNKRIKNSILFYFNIYIYIYIYIYISIYIYIYI